MILDGLEVSRRVKNNTLITPKEKKSRLSKGIKNTQ